MLHKFQVLKSSWGIVISVEIIDIVNPYILIDDVKVNDFLYIRLNTLSSVQDEKVLSWFSKAIKDVEVELHSVLLNAIACFNINSIKFILTDFQEEGLYCAMLGWLEKRYTIVIPKVEITFDSQSNRYLFKKEGLPLKL